MKKKFLNTWQIEMIVVAIVLLAVNFFAKTIMSIEIIASLAVLLSFGHAQIADRLAEKEALKTIPDVFCYRKLWYYFMGKEVLWMIYFLMNRSYSALVGVFAFLIYPVWRTWYRNNRKKK